MENNGYNDPNGYSDPNGENTYNYQQYNYQQYENQQYANQQYANFNGNMVDAAGNPLKSHFAIQLVFAIIEILLCCFSPIAMILGIIALVFAIQANTAFTQRRAEEFKAKSKTANILLIIGGVFAVIAIVINIIVVSLYATHFQDIFSYIENSMEEEYLYEEEWDDEGDLDEEYDSEIFEDYPGTDEEYLVEGFEKFTYNGVEYSVPMSYADFMEMGYTLEEAFDADDIVDAQNYETIGFYNEEGVEMGMIRVSNDTEGRKTLESCMIDYIYFDNPASYITDGSVSHIDLVFGNGFNMLTTYEELEEWFGTPYYVYVDSASEYESYEWVYYGEDKYQRLIVNYIEGTITDITFEQYDFVY